MIAHAIGAAMQSGLFEHVIVSTDDEEIAHIVREWGAEIPFMRPAELADDHTPTVPVIAHAINACQALGWNIEYVCCIYPCVPFIQAADLKCALELLRASHAAYSFPVTEFPSAIQRALRRLSDGRMQSFYPEFELTRTQDLELAYHDVGQFYWGKPDAWLTNNKIHRSGVGLPIPNWRVVDVDTPDDWARAEILYAAFNR
jgi:pseudaminic acid cytidylyltransferase